MSYECEGRYGSLDTPCSVFVYNGWYAVEGSCNVNFCPALHPDNMPPTYDGTNPLFVEGLGDTDMFTWPPGIESLDDLIKAVED